MARPHSPTPRRTVRTFALMAMLAALLGIVATGCGTEDDAKDADPQEQSEGDGAGTAEDVGSGDEDADAPEDDDEPVEDEPAADEEDA